MRTQHLEIKVDLNSDPNYVTELITISPSKAVEYYLSLNKERQEDIVEKVVSYLKGKSEKHLHVFLHHLHFKDKIQSVPYNHIQPKLYVKYNQELLLKFLKSTNEYSEDEVLQLCTKHHLLKETVYILEK